MDRLMGALSVLSGLLVILVMVSVRRAHVRVEYSVSWLAAGVSLFILSRWEGAVRWMASLLGLDQPALAIVFLGAAVFLLVFFRLTVIVSQLKDASVALTQRVAILEYRIQSIDGQSQQKDTGAES